MTHPVYTQQALCRYNLKSLKAIAAELGITPTGDKRATETWVNAIITHQSTQLQKVDNQTTAQPVASEKLTTVEISFYDHEIYALNELIASITHDNDLTQPWVVIVNGVEKFRANTWARCHRYITWHHQDGTLNEPLPAQTEALCTTGNEVMAQIFTECEKYGFEILDDGIYQNDQKLGEVGCTDDSWWVMRSGECQQQPCDSAMEAVWWLSMVDVLPHAEAPLCEELLDRPFEMLTAGEWEQLRQYEAVAERRELVTA
ncbi:hypothetical protein [Nostoc favosum]|uniref:SAP domain-containing protein n=1 Tax=Nostoc favosum CHAB5714 TaxID=2780399 RepID=A0ABS8IIZ7_9NOSO|nr:hypothetical protein [Nostoc favosum]MCC5603794.1 hypothetical protein [Nostoc favosum CHAB5714]